MHRCHYPVGTFGGGASSETDTYMHSTAHFAEELGAFPGKCYLSAMVLNTDYNNDDEYVVNTTVNGMKVHGLSKRSASADERKRLQAAECPS